MIQEINISSIESLISEINYLPNNYIYRGQSNYEWCLSSSLERVLSSSWNNDSIQKHEDFSLIRFKSKFHLYDSENRQPESKLEWLSIMQHYGVPTRLLDFTESPYVALYFALESYNFNSDNSLSLYAIDYSGLMNKSIEFIKDKDRSFNETLESIDEKKDEIFESIVDRFSYDICWVTEPKMLNKRLDRQAGSFLISGNKNKKIEDILSSGTYNNVNMTKIIINSELSQSIFSLLRKMNINGKSLYGDLDGLAKSISMEMRVYASK